MQMLEQNIINLYGKQGKQWLTQLPSLVTQLAAAYGLSNLKPVNHLSYHYVLSGFQGTKPVVLKLGLDIDGLKREAQALMAFSAFGVVQVISEDSGLLLLECALPGNSLTSYFPEKEDEAIAITANVMKRLHKAPLTSAFRFPHVKNWLTILDRDLPIPEASLKKARCLSDNLLKTSAHEVLLHGDLHHDNILQCGNDWVVIDPKGVIGEPCYEVAAFIRNPIPELLDHQDASNIIHHRVNRFANTLDLSPQRIVDWCFVQAVLAWIWTIEDNGDDAYFKHLTTCFDRYTHV